MRKLIYLFILLPALSLAATLSPTGYWQQINEKTNQPQSVLQIWQEKDGNLSGKIIGLYPVTGRELQKYCTKCTDDRRDQPIIGMTIINNMQPSTELMWTSGEILDPKAGSIYRCKITLSEDNKTLNVRGYVGIPLLGRSQTWIRLEPNELQQALKVIKTKT
ncbi:MAG: hypothetical protein K0S11_557 [Gammaproteobacteria bacterium]|nr:hypothetical protein [Gammaproteobacteria bacterium]